MTKSTITRERLEKIKSWRETYGAGSNVILLAEEAEELARTALAAMDSEPVAWEVKGILCHTLEEASKYVGVPEPLYADPRPEPTSAEPVAWLLSGGGTKNVVCFDSGNAYADPLREITPLYRHAQQPVVDADDNFYSWFGREWQENYQHNQYTTAAKQMLGVMAESAWKAGRRAAMLSAALQEVKP
ncbi:hypothetical protein [Raoultella ornithinolytica]|uniref:hypothetical protein n=1 Tax=Raoultella ornithinolytica TaxID=54291 RepID=UPI00384F2CFB